MMDKDYMNYKAYFDGWLHGFAEGQRDALSFLDEVQREVLNHGDLLVDYLNDYFSIDDEYELIDRININNRLAEWYVNEILK